MYFPSRGRARWVGGRRWRLSRRRQSPRSVSFYFPCFSFLGRKLYSFSLSSVSYFCLLQGMLVAKREPTPCYRDAYSVGTPKRAFGRRGGKGWQKNHCKTTFSPLFGHFFLVSKRTTSFFGVIVWMFHTGRARHPGPGQRFFTPWSAVG